MEIDLWAHEKEARRSGFSFIAGVDEAGRGPLAGPVVAAAVILPARFENTSIDDSKKLSSRKRKDLYKNIYEHALSIGIGIIDSREIDRINILKASLLCMRLAVRNLCPKPDFVYVDGKFEIPDKMNQKALPHGDALSISIAAASIVAKVSRDNLMERYHIEYPQFGFNKHKGYPTRSHRTAVKEFGPSLIHRRTFKGVRELCEPVRPL